MKRFRKLVIGGIETKIFNLILITVVLLTVAFMAVSVYHGNMLSDLAVQSSERQREAIGEATDSIMTRVVETSMGRTTELEAYAADEMFLGLATRVRTMAEYAEDLLTDESAVQTEICGAPDPAQEGTVVAQLILANGADAGSAELDRKLGLISNMERMMVTLFHASEETNSCFIALPEGAFLVADDRPASKFDSAGNLLDYDPRTRPWYQTAVEKGDLIFTDVEVDAFTGEIGIVCAMPVYRDGKLVAVVGSDLFLTTMRNAAVISGESGRSICVINGNGHVVLSYGKEEELQVRDVSEAQDLRLSENTELAALAAEALQQKTDVRLVTLSNGPCFMVGVPMKTLGWALISVFSQETLSQPSDMLKAQYDSIQEETTAVYLESTGHSRTTATVLLCVIAFLMLTGAVVLGKRIVRPLNRITREIAELSEDNLEFTMKDSYRTGDEIEVLAESFATLSHKTVQYVDQVRKVTAEKERISTELTMATQIQAAMLPHIFPPFPDRPDFDLYASMKPAKEVGGDFYDYFLIDSDHLCVVIADVSGKGVPAALFMMVSKIILQSCAMLGKSASEILTRTNDAICSNNDAEMFVTVWLGILELSTGKLSYANAGHEYPVVKRAEGPYELFRDNHHGFVVGGMEHVKYREYVMQLEPGDELFVYTDGIPEATDAENRMFGTDRLIETLNTQQDTTPVSVLTHVQDAVHTFVGSAPQFDDMTMLCLKYKGPHGVPEQATVTVQTPGKA